jgi:hypothetical protein
MILITLFQILYIVSYDLFKRETMGGWLWSLLHC